MFILKQVAYKKVLNFFKIVMVLFCCVLNCGSRAQRDNVRFFRIPSELHFKHKTTHNDLSILRRKKWLDVINHEEMGETKLKYAVICSRHFISGKPADLTDTLNPDWVPSIQMDCTPDFKKQRYKIRSKDQNEKQWNPESAIRLINLYREKTELWDPENNEFDLRNLRIDAWKSIAEELQCSVISIKNKMASLLCSFRREKEKMKKFLETRQDDEELYASKWFAFNCLDFLMDEDLLCNLDKDTPPHVVAAENVETQRYRESALRLINLYQEKPGLWNPQNEHFHLRNERMAAWKSIAEKSQCSVSAVKRKMASLLCSFRREKGKMRKFLESKKGRKKRYTSKWFAFSSLSFLMDKDLVCTLDKDTHEHTANDSDNSDYSDEETLAQILTIDDIEIEYESDEESRLEIPQVPPNLKTVDFYSKKRALVEDTATDHAINTKDNLKDECETYGDCIAQKLRKLNDHSRTLVMNHINNIILEAEMGNYSLGQDLYAENLRHSESVLRFRTNAVSKKMINVYVLSLPISNSLCGDVVFPHLQYKCRDYEHCVLPSSFNYKCYEIFKFEYQYQ